MQQNVKRELEKNIRRINNNKNRKCREFVKI